MSVTFSQIETKVKSFDFSTLSFHPGKNPIAYNFRKDCFEAFPEETNEDMAEQQNHVLFIGSLYESQAKKGQKPEIILHKERIQLITGELV